MKNMTAWHFLAANRRLRHGDSRKVQAGQTYRYLGEKSPVLGFQGMHGSVRALDALRYAPGPVACRVELLDVVEEVEDTAVAWERHVLWMADATDTLWEFTCWLAEGMLLGEVFSGRSVDARSWTAIEARRAFQRGEITKKELKAAKDAAYYAAYDAANDAANDAADCAAICAADCEAYYAAICAAEDMADYAAICAADCAARSAVRNLVNDELERRLNALHAA